MFPNDAKQVTPLNGSFTYGFLTESGLDAFES